MKATDILVEEHNIILKALECLEKIAQETEEKGQLNAEAARVAIDFFTNFADSCHHAKEEARLFPIMEKHGFPREGGPTGMMMMEHENGRELVRAMAKEIEDASRGQKEAMHHFSVHAHDFNKLLTEHIFKENQILFPMADNALPDDVKENLLADFRQIELNSGKGRHTRYLGVVRNLCQQYQIQFLEQNDFKTIHEEFLG